MRRDLGSALRLLVIPTLALVAVVAFSPGRAGLAVRIYVLVLCAVALGLTLRALRRTYPAATPLSPATKRTRSRRSPPSSLARIEHETALGVASTFDLHYRLLPRLRAVAAGLLATRRAISPDADPDAARRVLGDETWDLVRRDRPPPEERLARGIQPTELGRVVESLERL
jgi:hypothetical protein